MGLDKVRRLEHGYDKARGVDRDFRSSTNG